MYRVDMYRTYHVSFLFSLPFSLRLLGHFGLGDRLTLLLHTKILLRLFQSARSHVKSVRMRKRLIAMIERALLVVTIAIVHALERTKLLAIVRKLTVSISALFHVSAHLGAITKLGLVVKSIDRMRIETTTLLRLSAVVARLAVVAHLIALERILFHLHLLGGRIFKRNVMRRLHDAGPNGRRRFHLDLLHLSLLLNRLGLLDRLCRERATSSTMRTLLSLKLFCLLRRDGLHLLFRCLLEHFGFDHFGFLNRLVKNRRLAELSDLHLKKSGLGLQKLHLKTSDLVSLSSDSVLSGHVRVMSWMFFSLDPLKNQFCPVLSANTSDNLNDM